MRGLALSERPRFGPAGKPPLFKGPIVDVPRYLHEEGLDAFEYQGVRWGAKMGISEKDASELEANAQKYDVWMTFHASYFVNLSSDKEETISQSKERLITAVKAARLMGAKQVVFHPGFYGKLTSQRALSSCIRSMREVVEEVKNMGIGDVFLGPETTGKRSQVGSLEEIIRLCQEVEMTRPTIDWAHIHARGIGSLRTKDDYLKVVDMIERLLGSDVIKNLHCHYTPVEFTEKGERCHHTMDEVGFGPDFRPLAEMIVEQGLNHVIISESPLLDLDSIKMRDLVLGVQRRNL